MHTGRVQRGRAPVLVVNLVELLEQLHARHHLLGQHQVDALVRGPEAGGEDLRPWAVGGNVRRGNGLQPLRVGQKEMVGTWCRGCDRGRG